MDRTLLFLAYFFPPRGGAGVQRSVKFAKYLPQFAWKPLVIAHGGMADNASGVMDPSLLKDFRVKETVAAAVAEESLRTYDQNNDTRRGPITEVKTLPPVPGSSGLQVTFKPNPLLEGYRPKRYLRVFWGGWRVDDLPREERLYR